MPLPCLSLTNGLLLPAGPPWQTGNQTVNLPNGTVLVSATAGNNPGISVTKGAGSQFFSKPATGNLHFMVFGSPLNFVAILSISDTTPNIPATRTVSFVDITGATPVVFGGVLTITASSTQSLPALYANLGNGSVCFLWAGDGFGSVTAAIRRSDTGATLCAATPFTPAGQVSGEVTATLLLVKDGGVTVASAARPAGISKVTPDPQNFPDAVVGPGVPPALSTSQRPFTIRNNGADCLTVNGIGNIAPYSVVSTSPSVPAILDTSPMTKMTVDVKFAPTSVGQFDVDLPLTLAPPGTGDVVLKCRGKARSPNFSISLVGPPPFNNAPLGTSPTGQLKITNTGEADVTVTMPASSGGDFQWSAISALLHPMASITTTVTFTPTSELSQSVNLTVTSTPPGSTHTVTVSGTGCVARAQISITNPAGPNVDYGPVERGFRLVRTFTVHNAGNGPLTFRASVTGGPLFRIQLAGGSLTAPVSTENFSVPPVSACGPLPIGSGDVVFGVVFFADMAPGLATAQLVIDNHNVAGAPASFTLNLLATIASAINVDAELVLDRSGSMSETSGSRTKIATTIDAARLFVALSRVDVDDRLGLVKFNTTPNVFSAITPVTTANQLTLATAINGTELAPTGNTAIAGGVIEAERDFSANPRATVPLGLRRAIIVLTDGKDNTPYTNPDDGILYSLLGGDGATALPVPTGIRIYGIGIGDSIDTGRLGQLAQATGGVFLHVLEFTGTDFFKLEKHFTQIYMDTVDLATIRDPVYTIVPGDQHVIDFDVLRGDVATMVVVYDRDGIRLPFWLETPQHETIEVTSVPPGFQLRPGITDTARFLEVRFPMGDPTRYAGVWKLNVKHDGRACFVRPLAGPETHVSSTQPPGRLNPKEYSFGFQPMTCHPYGNPIMYGFAIGVGSNFRMMPYLFPGIVKVGEPIQLNAEISECGLPVLGCATTVSSRAPDGVVRNFTLLDDGAHGDGGLDDGDYGHLFTQTTVEGTYEFTFRATGYTRDGEAVEREAVRSKYVEGRVPLVPVDGNGKDMCCERNQRWLQVLAGMLVLILIVLIFIWRR